MKNHRFPWLRNRTTDNRKCEKACNIKEKRTIEMFNTASRLPAVRPSSASAKRQFTLSREYSKSPGAYGFGAFFCVGQRACACALGLCTQGGPITVHMPGGTP